MKLIKELLLRFKQWRFSRILRKQSVQILNTPRMKSSDFESMKVPLYKSDDTGTF
jgi:hypothetical protein